MAHRLQYLVDKSPVAFSTVVDGGAIVEQRAGEEAGAELVVTLKRDAVAALGSGLYTLDEGFMRGSIKVEGPIGVLMELLPLLRTAEYGAAVGAAASAP